MLRLGKGLQMIKMSCAENGCKESDGEYDICEAVSTHSISSIKTKEDLIQAYPKVYDGEKGCIKGYKYHLELQPDYTAKVNAVRRISYKYRQALKDEFSQLENEGIIHKTWCK